jgi:hypothetical protein
MKTGETEVLVENLPQRHFVHHKSHLTRPRARTRAAAVGSQRLTGWAMARPMFMVTFFISWSLKFQKKNMSRSLLRLCDACRVLEGYLRLGYFHSSVIASYVLGNRTDIRIGPHFYASSVFKWTRVGMAVSSLLPTIFF